MTHTYSAGASRQPAVFTAIIALHLGLYFAILNGLGPHRPEGLKKDPPIIWQPEPDERPTKVVEPNVPNPMPGMDFRVEEPTPEIPRFDDPPPTVTARSETNAGGELSGHGPVTPDYVQPRLRTPDRRLAALIDACYPAASRRLGEEGRAVARVMIGAQSTALSWRIAESSGFPRLDAAMDCVIQRLDFVVARRDGSAVAAEVLLPIAFRLD